MKTAPKLAALLATTFLFAGCMSTGSSSESGMDSMKAMHSMKASIEEARAAAVQANQYSQQALQMAQQNATKIDRVFHKSQMK